MLSTVKLKLTRSTAIRASLFCQSHVGLLPTVSASLATNLTQSEAITQAGLSEETFRVFTYGTLHRVESNYATLICVSIFHLTVLSCATPDHLRRGAKACPTRLQAGSGDVSLTAGRRVHTPSKNNDRLKDSTSPKTHLDTGNPVLTVMQIPDMPSQTVPSQASQHMWRENSYMSIEIQVRECIVKKAITLKF